MCVWVFICFIFVVLIFFQPDDFYVRSEESPILVPYIFAKAHFDSCEPTCSRGEPINLQKNKLDIHKKFCAHLFGFYFQMARKHRISVFCILLTNYFTSEVSDIPLQAWL